ncbi:MAG: fluoride efflux transporter CrcB [Chloroflexi bacterium]|nr:fluoride efflux transporter CrcB [Chloroflexota bacterium]MCI0579037.1 fluoride efflux transporter CrcB [Chloroflexota bacterium]MCI0646964.1 fluoride efflux transporter CrcB [Chloroflexota bacterium]MCI0729277.1 fluoride efflux transporter CrcB [Chloroflexota bacterium]
MSRYLLITMGAALGANARYLVGIWAANRLGADFPYGTLIVNISGSFLLGFILTLASERLSISPETRLLLAVGFLGSYTTFSSYTVESLNLLRNGTLWSGLLNVFSNNLVGLASAFLGAYLARLVR